MHTAILVGSGICKRANAFFIALCLLALLAPQAALAQAIGSIIGTVADPSGALVAGATVTATNADTQLSKAVVTGSAGEFTLSNLTVGKYNVKAEASGFSTSRIDAVTLDVSQTRSIDFKLVPGGQSDTAIVTAAPPLINTTDPSLAGLVSEEQVQTLPLNGRSIQNLVMLQPGMAQDNNGSMGWLSPQWIGNGNRGETEVATLDGADSTDEEMGTIQFWNFNLDAIAEFKVQQANYTAEYGRGGGTITQIVSKSGTNQFHGSAFEFIRNGALDASNYFSTTGAAPFQRNEFGVAGGGPIFRNKTFFFGEYAGFRQRLGEPTTMIVPTQDQRSGLVSINGFTYQVPLDAVAAGILAKYPLPNNPNGIYGANTFTKQFKQPLDVNQFSVRIDHHISEKDFLFGRASYINNESRETDAVAAIEDPSFSATQMNNPRNYAVSETHLFSPNMINLAMLTGNRQIEASLPPSQAYTQTTFSDGSLSTWGPDTFITKYVETYYDPSDKITWTKGRHNLNIGIDYRYGQDNGFGVTSAGPNGVYTFNAATALVTGLISSNGGPAIAAGSPSPTGLVSMMEGTPITYNRATTLPGFGPTGGGGTHWGLREWHLASYVQDDVRFTPKLTVNLGVRYEYASVPYEIRNRLGGIIDQPGDLYGHFVLNPDPLYKAQKANFSPRLGAAYRATDKTVVRGGFAIFTNSIPTVYPDQAAVNLPMASLSVLNNPQYSLTPLAVSLPALTSTNGAIMPPGGDTTKIPAKTPVNLAPLAAVIGNIAGDWPSDKLKNGYTITGNVTVEQQIPGDMAMQVSYVTNNSTNLYNTGYPNAYNTPEPQYAPFSAVTPGLGEVQLFYNQGTFHYNALQVQMRKISPLHGLQYQATYTWSKDLTDADAVWSASGTNGAVSLNDPTCIRCEYARASYDVAQRFVANFSYNVPGRWGFVPSILSSGWQTLGIFSAQTGFPFTITEPYGTLQYGYDSLNGAGARPNQTAAPGKGASGVPQYLSSDVINNPGNYFASETTTASNGNTVQVTPGTLGRNTVSGPGWWNGDFSLIKNTQLAENLRMEFRSEFFNIFNHSTFNTPNGVIGSGSFGRSTATQSAERQIQFGARLVF